MNNKVIMSLLCMGIMLTVKTDVDAQTEVKNEQPVATEYPMGPGFKRFRKQQQEFKRLAEKQGVAVQPTKVKEVRKSKRTSKAGQSQFDQIRSSLNRTLKKPGKLTADERKDAEVKIQKLREMGSQLWPGPKDYENLLKLHE
jgi:ABC-type uncharacterized transport system substrate-binding protein